MALLNRLFPSKKKSSKPGYVSFGRSDAVSWKPFNFNKEQVRVLLFRECDARGRKLLFDSNSVQKTPLEHQHCSKHKFGTRTKGDTNKKTETYVEISNGFGYQYMRPGSDVTLMGEMVFGSVAMTFRGVALKVHSMSSPDRLMCTKVFHAPQANHASKRTSDHSLEDSYGSSMNSIGEYIPGQNNSSDVRLGSSSGSGPLDVPYSSVRGKVPGNSLEGDSGFYGDASLHSISSMGSGGLFGPFTTSPESRNGSASVLGSGSGHSGGSLASLQRRWLRNVSTSLEIGMNSSWVKGSGSSGRIVSDEAVPYNQRKTQLGLTVVISLTPDEEKEMQQFFFELMAVIEGMVERLRWSVERAYIRKDMFVHLMMEGYQDLQQWLCDLFSAPRLSCPMWMYLVSAEDHTQQHHSNKRNVATNFLRDFCQLIAAIDTKATNFFVSTLITAVLTHHLGWVATVLPTMGPPNHVSRSSCTVDMLSALAKSHPYNALWAQLGDVYGALGNPARVARTIITANGKKSDLVSRLLNIISYFIRCGDIEKTIDNRVPTEEETETLNSFLSDQSITQIETSLASTATILAENSMESAQNATGFCDQLLKDQVLGMSHEGANYNAFKSDVPKCIEPLSLICNEVKENCQENICKTVSHNHCCSLCFASKNASNARKMGCSCSCGAKQCEVIIGSNHSTTTLCENRLEKDMNSKTCYNLQVLDPSTYSSKHLSESSVYNISEPATKPALGMRRSTSFMCKSQGESEINADSLEHSRLYPCISNFVSEQNEENEKVLLNPEVISEKVNRLCRVPKKAVLCHLQTSQPVVDFVEEYHHKKVESERQLSAVDVSKKVAFEVSDINEKYRKHSNIKNNVTEHAVQSPNRMDNVTFVLGENEELVGLKSKSTTNKNKVTCLTEVQNGFDASVNQPIRSNVYPSLDGLLTSENGFQEKDTPNVINKLPFIHSSPKADSYNFHGQDRPVTDVLEHLNSTVSFLNSKSCSPDFISNGVFGLDSGIVLDEQTPNAINFVSGQSENNCKSKAKQNERTNGGEVCSTNNCRIVTAHSFVIELERECGDMEVKISDPPRISKPVVRSQSLSFPLRKSVSKRITNICRRHSEYIHENERYLKDYHSVRFNFERCESVLMDYVGGTGAEKSPQTDKKSLKINGARGNFELQDNSGKPFPCESCSRESDIHSDTVLSNRELCSDFHSKEGVLDSCSIKHHRSPDMSKLHSQMDENREGNALFDEYGTLSDEEALASTECNDKNGSGTERNGVPNDRKRMIMLPLPKCTLQHGEHTPGLAASLLGGVMDHYVADLVLHGCTQPIQGWEKSLRRDLALAAHHPVLDQEISEAVCIVGNADLWEVQLVSSYTSVVDSPGTFGIRVGMSQLVANMLESLVHLWRLRTPPNQCLLHLESKLRELCLRSQALAELLLTTEFCDMASLTSALDLEANDVPLLLAVASTHTPQVTCRYGLSFR